MLFASKEIKFLRSVLRLSLIWCTTFFAFLLRLRLTAFAKLSQLPPLHALSGEIRSMYPYQ